MRMRYGSVLVMLAVCLFFAGTRSYSQDAAFKLKPGATGKICMTCHVTFQDKLKSPSVHTPVRTGDCSKCHNPHASSFGKLLYADPSKLCAQCHAMVPDKAASVHQVVLAGNCVVCHDTHASPYPKNLLKKGNELCYGCHKGIAEKAGKAKFKHYPVEKGCLSCHSAHASMTSRSLLKEPVPSLCVSCHKTGTQNFVKRHMNYPVAKANCISCHNPHGSSRGGILFDTVHKPVVEKMCAQCHDDPGSADPFRVKKEGYGLCQVCHSTMINDMLGKNRMHWPVVSRRGCLSCHTPHASAETALLSGPRVKLCASCHEDTIARQDRALGKHAPVTQGSCNACHAPHSSNNTFLLNKDIIDQCGTCHNWKLHSSHPVGEKMRDPRNKNLYVQCLSCHSSHGTPFEKMIFFATTPEMCTQCHAKYGR